MIVGVIGAGRVGAILGAALTAAGHEVVAVSGASATAKRLLPGVEHLPPDQVALKAKDLLIIAVPDDALAGVISGLARMDVFHPGQIVAHTSGAHGLDVLLPAINVGARPLALHPAMTFAGTPADLERMRGVSFGVTAPSTMVDVASQLVADLGGLPEWIANEKRSLYHAALAHGANHLVTLVNEAADRLRDAGVLHPEKVLGPLLGAALDNSLRMGDNALTGPVSRGDAGTVARHIAVLGETAPDSLPAYRALARRTADRAITAGRLRPADAEALLDVLATPATVEAAK
ncbi:MAG TPA: DUF2520 domain-containing protein [Micromonosporaceae bacterium]|nr:DUF2520 domain-containing protein [Micromonosporaceae bacterium]